jgi:hypothetical protein
LDGVREERAGPSVAEPLQNNCVSGEKGNGSEQKIAARRHLCPGKRSPYILFQDKSQEGRSLAALIQLVT